MDNLNLKIEYIDVDKLTPYERNTRKHTDKDIDIIAKSIEKYGFNDAIGIWGKKNIVVEGHGRLLAAKKLGMDKVPCVRLDHLTEQGRREYAIAHNRSAEMSEWDFDILPDELEGLDFEGFDFGFDLDMDEESEAEAVEDDYDEEPPAEPKSKLGDIYQLGRHRLMCGNSTNSEDVARLMDGKKADMVFTDPPYGYEYQSNMRTKSTKFDVIENDDKLLDFIPAIKNYVDGFVFVCTTWKVLKEWISYFESHYSMTNMIIWDKGGGGIGDLAHTFLTDYEIMLVSNNGKEINGKRIGSVWSIAKDNPNNYKHATQKPVELSATAIAHTTSKNGVVMDVFGGSGSTLIACEQLDRTCYMMELSPQYIDVIIDRWEKFTGKKAVLLND